MKDEELFYKRLLYVFMSFAIIVNIASCSMSKPPENTYKEVMTVDANAIKSDTIEKTITEAKVDYINIPGVDKITFKANSIYQSVCFKNPENNPCYFVVQIVVNDEVIYQSDLIPPSCEINEIELTKPIAKGFSDTARLIYKCYSLETQTPLNGASVIVNIEVV